LPMIPKPILRTWVPTVPILGSKSSGALNLDKADLYYCGCRVLA
jgi:hypothetical protein